MNIIAKVVAWSAVVLGGVGALSAAPAGMALVPGGVYHPLFASPAEAKSVEVKSFYLDTFPVTTGDYLEFVRANPQWRRSRVKRIFADEGYLANWPGDLVPPMNQPLDVPVTSVSWFAAKAYAEWKGKRLPAVAEWERAAEASPTRPDGENDPAFKRAVLQWYATPSASLASVHQSQTNFWGVCGLHGLVWEWVLDFNSELISSDSRGDGGGGRGLFCGAGAQGARDVEDYPAFMRAGFRSSLKANYCIHNLGFRCAKDL